MSLGYIKKLIKDIADTYKISNPYIVGGLPRDIYLDVKNIKTSDIDITTNSPESLRLGILVADKLNVPFELSDDGHVTVFYEDFDLDFSSNFISDAVLKVIPKKYNNVAEAFSRDFTINTLQQDLSTDKIIDPTEKGFSDIENKIIDTPVLPEITLLDDPRRIYRAINLAARYEFDISERIKDFVIKNKEVFGSKNVKDKYILAKISKALRENEDITLKLLIELDLLKNVPLSGYFKDVLIRRKMLTAYLENPALDGKVASAPSSWDEYQAQGKDYIDLSNWWKANYSKIPGNFDASYNSWTGWYMDNYRNNWGYVHKGPREVIDILNDEIYNKNNKVISKEPSDDSLSSKHTDEYYGKIQSHDIGVEIKSGVNVENVTQDVKDFIKYLGEKAAYIGASKPVITSGWRSLESQADIMSNNWKNNGGLFGGRAYLENLYGREFGGQVAYVLENYGLGEFSNKRIVSMLKKRPIGSYHIQSPGKAIDLANTSGIKEVLDEINSEGRYKIKIVDETHSSGPHYHVVIFSKNTVNANIDSRIGRMRKLNAINNS